MQYIILVYIINANLYKLVLLYNVDIGEIVMAVSRIFIGGSLFSEEDGMDDILYVTFFVGFVLGKGFIGVNLVGAFIRHVFL